MAGTQVNDGASQNTARRIIAPALKIVKKCALGMFVGKQAPDSERIYAQQLVRLGLVPQECGSPPIRFYANSASKALCLEFFVGSQRLYVNFSRKRVSIGME